MNHSHQSFDAETRNGPHESVALAGRMWATLINVMVTFAAVGVYAAIPQFKSLFIGFGADLPVLTRLVIQPLGYLWLVMFVSLLAQQALFIVLLVRRSFLSRRIFRILALLNFVAVVIFIVSFYLPVFELGSVV